MAILPIATYDDPVLREKCSPVSEPSEQLHELIDDMFDTMYNADGVGLAAPQVGVSIRLFVADVDPITEEEEGQTYGAFCMINPEIIETGGEEIQMEEGCLSIPEVTGPVTRPAEIKVKYLDANFEEKQLNAGGWLARVIQHEIDHLDGVLFLDHLSLFKRKLLGSSLKEIAEGRKEIEYPVKPTEEKISKQP